MYWRSHHPDTISDFASDCSAGSPNWTAEAISDAFNVHFATATNVRKVFAKGGFEQALNWKKLDREYEHRLDGNAEAHLIALVCSTAPEGYTRWTLRLLRDRFVKLEIVESVSRLTQTDNQERQHRAPPSRIVRPE